MNNYNARANQQQGGALLIFMLVLVLAASAILFSILDGREVKIEREKKTTEALSKAKSALIGWSVLQINMGRLPCPEDATLIGYSTEGSAKATCTLPAVGRLPWKTLGLGDVRDGNGDKLWYVISEGFRVSPINNNTPAQLTVDGVAGKAVAIVFSPGSVLSTQVRAAVTNANPPVLSQYLDLANNDGDNTFVTNGAATNFNDRLLLVKHSDIFTPVVKRVLSEIKGDNAQGLESFYADSAQYPYADINANGDADSLATTGTPSYNGGTNNLFFSSALRTSLINNAWFTLVTYNVASDLQSVNLSLNGQTVLVQP